MAGRDRKNSLKALFGEPSMPAPETKAQPSRQVATPEPAPVPAKESEAAAPQQQRTSSGAVKAMGLSLNSLTRDAEEVRALRQAMEEGERIIEIDPDKIASSFVSDRLSDAELHDPDFAALVESIAESGQQVPILVRPHAEETGRFQVAYGHRRLKAAAQLGQPVRAIIRPLSDDELVLAQGKENAERRNLSFIERAVFAKVLSDRGFDRKLVGEALSVQKSELSRLMQVAEAVPSRVARAIGPAPKAGRERWMALAAIFENGKGSEQEKSAEITHSDAFKAADTDKRFQLIFNGLSQKKPAQKPKLEEIKGANGQVIARVNRSGKSAKIEFSAGLEAEFVDRISALIETEYARFAGDAKG